MRGRRMTAGTSVAVAAVAVAGAVVVAVVAVAAAVSAKPAPRGAASGSSAMRATSSSFAATRACAHAFGSSNVGSASRTTIGDVRRSGGGPPVIGGTVGMPASHAFGDEPASALAYWCWVGHPGDWTLYGIDTHGTRVEMYEEYDHTQPFPVPSAPDGPAFWL